MTESSAGRQSRSRPAGQVMEDGLFLRLFTLADHAAVPPDSKLYLSGAGVNTIWLQEIPGRLSPLWLAALVRIPWNMTSEQLPILVRALDANRNPVGPD